MVKTLVICALVVVLCGLFAHTHSKLLSESQMEQIKQASEYLKSTSIHQRKGASSRLDDPTEFLAYFWLYQGSLYNSYLDPANWDISQERCFNKQNGNYTCNLTSIRDESENYFLGKYVRALEGDFWLGLTYEPTDGGYKWVDGTPFNYQKWADGEPNNPINYNRALFTEQGWVAENPKNPFISVYKQKLGEPSDPDDFTGQEPTIIVLWFTVTEHGVEIYIRLPIETTYDELDKLCKGDGGEGSIPTLPTSLHNAAENTFVKQYIQSVEGDFFIGLTYNQSAKSHQWADGTPVKINDWAQGEPKTPELNVNTLLTAKGWVAVNDDARHFGLCKIFIPLDDQKRQSPIIKTLA